MKRRNYYCVEFRLRGSGVQRCGVIASSKEEAYDTAVFEEIPKLTGELPYSAWVYSVTYNNGNYHLFNTFEGMPY